MGNNSHILDFSSKANTSQRRAEVRPLPLLVEQASTLCINELNTGLQKMFEQADDFLFDMSDSGYNNAHFDAMRILRLKKEGLIRHFQQEMKNSFKENLGKVTQSDDYFDDKSLEMSFENIALVKDDDLEEGIAIDGMVKKARNANLEAIEQIRTRLDTLISNKSISQQNNPFEPAFICDAFKQASSTLDIDIESLLVIYKLFERVVISQLSDAYHLTNQFFIDKGVLPQLKLTTKPPKASSESTKSIAETFTDALNDISKSKQSSAQVDNHQQTNDQIISLMQNLLAQNRKSDAGAELLGANQSEFGHNNNSAAVQKIDTVELMNALTQLQLSSKESFVGDRRKSQHSDLRDILATQLGSAEVSAQNGAISQFNNDMIDIVSMLFDFILDDKNLHVEIKSVIARLQIPMLKVGIVDRAFFSNRKHPARILLNEIARAGISWDPGDAEASSMLQKIESICEEIITNFKDDLSIFDYLLKDFEEFQLKIQRRADIFERRTKEAEEGKAKAESARSIVNKELEKICKGRLVPASVRMLLKNVWVHVMLLERLKDNQEGWETSCKLAQLLVWSAQPLNDAIALDKLVSRIPLIVKNLRKGFGIVSLSPIEATHLLDQLEITHRAVIKQAQEKIENAGKEEILRLEPVRLIPEVFVSKGNLEKNSNSDSLAANSEDSMSLLNDPVEIQDIGFSAVQIGEKETNERISVGDIRQESLQVVESLRAGVWVELAVGSAQSRCKLAAKISTSGKFIFVNRSGAKMAEYYTNELAIAYQLGKIKILDDEALFDRALESVISNLRAMKADS